MHNARTISISSLDFRGSHLVDEKLNNYILVLVSKQTNISNGTKRVKNRSWEEVDQLRSSYKV